MSRSFIGDQGRISGYTGKLSIKGICQLAIHIYNDDYYYYSLNSTPDM